MRPKMRRAVNSELNFPFIPSCFNLDSLRNFNPRKYPRLPRHPASFFKPPPSELFKYTYIVYNKYYASDYYAKLSIP